MTLATKRLVARARAREASNADASLGTAAQGESDEGVEKIYAYNSPRYSPFYAALALVALSTRCMMFRKPTPLWLVRDISQVRLVE